MFRRRGINRDEAAAYVQAAGDESVRRHARRALREAREAVDEYSRAKERRGSRRGARVKLLLAALAAAGASAAAVLLRRRRAAEERWDAAPAAPSAAPVTQPLSAVPVEPAPTTEGSAPAPSGAATTAEPGGLAATPSFSEDQSWKGSRVTDAAGEEIGRLQDVYYDDESGRPEWAVVSTGSVRPRLHFVPLLGASWREDELGVAHARQAVLDAPDIDDDGTLSASEEESLYRHYGMERPSALRLSRRS